MNHGQGLIAVAAAACVAAVLAMAPSVALACSTERLNADGVTDLTPYDSVFTGTAVRLVEPFTFFTQSSVDPMQWTFAVDEVEKGSPGERVTVQTARLDASCGASFTLGHRYRVLARSSGPLGFSVIYSDVSEVEPLADAPALERGGINPLTSSGIVTGILLAGLSALVMIEVVGRRAGSQR